LDLRDFIVTPVLLIIVYAVAYAIRPRVTDEENYKFFLPALTVKICGAIALGLLYQFYYNGGDTYNFHTHGSRHIWEAFSESTDVGLKLLFSDGKDELGIYKYSRLIPFFRDPTSYTVIRIAAFFDLITFSSYSGTAVFFAIFSFIGSWMLFLTFYQKYPGYKMVIAVAVLFIPSVAFWGSGIMKDSLVLSSLGVATYSIDRMFGRRRFSISFVLILLASLYLIFVTKKFVLQAFLPSAILWVFLTRLHSIRSVMLRILVVPVLLSITVVSAYFTVMKVGQGDARYDVEKLATTAKITATDIRYQTGRDAGSGYSLGEQDGSFGTMIRMLPQAINVSLFRPYFWEVRNPLMLLSAIESFALLLLTLYTLFKVKMSIFRYLTNPDVAFTMIFALIFAFAVGISTYNFGTLSRYKIPLIPCYMISVCLILYLDKLNRERKLAALDSTE
jgi:hypothetical protein